MSSFTDSVVDDPPLISEHMPAAAAETIFSGSV
jgi:hypothetical protein